MGKRVRERLIETIRRDKLEINKYNNNKQGSTLKKEDKEEKEEEDIYENKDILKILDANEVLKGLVKEDNDFEEDLDESFDNLDFKRKKLIVILIILIIALSTVLVLWSNGNEIVNFALNKVEKIDENKNGDFEIDGEDNQIIAAAPINLEEYYEKVHHMANTIIIASDGKVWGKIEITKEAVSKIINDLKGNDDYLSNELTKWLNMDFSNGVEVHNYVWDKLGGSVGKAKALNEEKINQIIKMLKE